MLLHIWHQIQSSSQANRFGSAADGRLSFIDTYRNTYSSTSSIEGHIKSGENSIKSGRKALGKERQSYRGMYFPPAPGPDWASQWLWLTKLALTDIWKAHMQAANAQDFPRRSRCDDQDGLSHLFLAFPTL